MVRGAYTLSSYLEGTGTNLRLPINPPFAHEARMRTTLRDALPGSTLEPGLPAIRGNAERSLCRRHSARLGSQCPARRLQSVELHLQHQFANNTTLQVGYVGQRTTHLMVPMPYLQEQLLRRRHCRSERLSWPAIRRCRTRSGRFPAPLRTATRATTPCRPVLLKRFSNGLEYSVAYTYSKCMTDSSGYYGSWGGQTTPTSPYWQNLYDKKAEWGPCYYDATHVLTSYATYDLPVGRDRKFGKNMNKVVDAVSAAGRSTAS